MGVIDAPRNRGMEPISVIYSDALKSKLRPGLSVAVTAETVMAKKKDTKIDFETSLKDLEALVERMETGDLSLEESLIEFERGMKLSESCQKALQAAELKIETITAKYQNDTDIDDD